ncbi:MAG: rRNA maturation RNase YbeY [Ruminococcaceae bacterium]|nr:rRNA maturation RNase YbeY [Oscillospiraceae bacterium]
MSAKVYLRREKRNLGHIEARQLIIKAVRAALSAEGIKQPCEVSVLLTDNEGIRKLNHDYRNIDKPTDVLSFPSTELSPGEFSETSFDLHNFEDAFYLGDIAISLEKCAQQAKEYNNSFDRELQYLTVHSTLHLLGYDHVDEAEMKKTMRAREKAAMELL